MNSRHLSTPGARDECTPGALAHIARRKRPATSFAGGERCCVLDAQALGERSSRPELGLEHRNSKLKRHEKRRDHWNLGAETPLRRPLTKCSKGGAPRSRGCFGRSRAGSRLASRACAEDQFPRAARGWQGGQSELGAGASGLHTSSSPGSRLPYGGALIALEALRK
jgi:hypothetical protein